LIVIHEGWFKLGLLIQQVILFYFQQVLRN
jgi:hypothetical protein